MGFFICPVLDERTPRCLDIQHNCQTLIPLTLSRDQPQLDKVLHWIESSQEMKSKPQQFQDIRWLISTNGSFIARDTDLWKGCLEKWEKLYLQEKEVGKQIARVSREVLERFKPFQLRKVISRECSFIKSRDWSSLRLVSFIGTCGNSVKEAIVVGDFGFKWWKDLRNAIKCRFFFLNQGRLLKQQ